MKKSILFIFVFLCSINTFAQWNYPATKTVDISDTYFGVTYKDPYRWLENIKEPEVSDWFKQQSDYTNSIMNKISGRDELITEWKMLAKLIPPRYSSQDYKNGRIFYKKTMPGENVGKIYFREGYDGEEILLFDPIAYIPGKTLSVNSIISSFDGKKILISYSESGAEISTIKVLDVDSRTFLPESIYPSWFGPIGWTFDNKAFLYFSQKTADNTSPEFELNTKTKLHKLGDDVKNDIDFFSNESYPDLNIQPNDLPFASINEDSKNYIFANLSNVRQEMTLFYAPIEQFNNPKIDWKVLCKPEDKLVRGFAAIGDRAFAITYNNAKNYKLIETDLKNPDWKNARIVAEEKEMTLEGISYSKNYLFLTYSDGINGHLFKYNLNTEQTTPINLPFGGNASIYCFDTKTNNCFVSITSWNKPFTEFCYDAETDAFSPTIFNKPGNYPEKYLNIEVEEVEVKGHDGTMIPLSIIYNKGLVKDGKNVCLMESYGAYGSSMSPYFSIFQMVLEVKGVVYAVPHVRGGSEKGDAWYKGGYKTTKPNTWKDFISCAEYLIANGYTSPDRIAGTGTSAGGVLISRAITERPDLFRAAICNVGCANAIRMEFSPNGPANIPEFGTVKDSIECKALFEMDGVQHVVKGTKYPALICVGGWNDPRVIAWEPGKFAAAVQNATTSGKPVLLKINYDSGHFTEDLSVTMSNFADQFAFVLWQCGHPDFQLKE